MEADLVARFRCPACGRLRGEAEVTWGRFPILDRRLDPNATQPSRKEQHGGAHQIPGVTFTPLTGEPMRPELLRAGKRIADAKTWRRVDRGGRVYLEWDRPCRCKHQVVADEDELRDQVYGARDAVWHANPGPVTVTLPRAGRR